MSDDKKLLGTHNHIEWEGDNPENQELSDKVRETLNESLSPGKLRIVKVTIGNGPYAVDCSEELLKDLTADSYAYKVTLTKELYTRLLARCFDLAADPKLAIVEFIEEALKREGY